MEAEGGKCACPASHTRPLSTCIAISTELAQHARATTYAYRKDQVPCNLNDHRRLTGLVPGTSTCPQSVLCCIRLKCRCGVPANCYASAVLPELHLRSWTEDKSGSILKLIACNMLATGGCNPPACLGGECRHAFAARKPTATSCSVFILTCHSPGP